MSLRMATGIAAVLFWAAGAQADPIAPAAATVANPDWVRVPSADFFIRYYPQKAQVSGVGGRAVITCLVEADYTVGDCVVTSETPAGWGFGDAAIKLATLFKLKPFGKDGQPTAHGKIVIPIRFQVPEAVPPPSTDGDDDAPPILPPKP